MKTSHANVPQNAPKTYRMAVIGGDARMIHAAERLASAGHAVDLVGCGGNCLPCEAVAGRIRVSPTVSMATLSADVTTLVLPLPATRDGRTVWCPRDPACALVLDELADLMNRRPTLRLFGGRLPAGFADRIRPLPEKSTSRVTDYYEDEALQLRNAYLTAEGALMSAMELAPHALRGSTVAVIGYGRIGKLLTRLLLALGAEVTVCARREETLLWAEMDGAHPLRLGDSSRAGGGLYPLCYGHSILFNTVPACVLDYDLLSRMEKGTALIDLASAPFGVADEDVRRITEAGGVHYVRAPSIPGTYAPRDAGIAIADSILHSLRSSP